MQRATVLVQAGHPADDGGWVLDLVQHGGTDRWIWRWSSTPRTSPPTPVELRYTPAEAIITIGGETWSYPSEDWRWDPENAKRVLMWHWEQYFKHLLAPDRAKEEAEKFAASENAQAETLASANRAAHSWLYDAAYRAGWRKLSLRQKLRYWGPAGADQPSWHRVEDLPQLGDPAKPPRGAPRGRRRDDPGPLASVDVAGMAGRGMSDVEIGAALGVSRHIVQRHRQEHGIPPGSPPKRRTKDFEP